jgi:hypothetical protein
MRGQRTSSAGPGAAVIEAAIAALVAQGDEVLPLSTDSYVLVPAGAPYRALVEARELVETAQRPAE